MDEELKPCPFCGETPSANSYEMRDGGFKYGCIACGCGAQGPDVRTGYKDWPHWRDAAVAEWNQRPAIPDDHLLIPRTLLAALLDGDSNVSLVAAHELRGLLEADRQK